MQIVHSAEDLLDGLGRIFLGELALLADPIEEFSAGGKLRDDIVFILPMVLA